ncbi:MAG: putative Ig domain-containing protein [Rickettsiales bacterium]|nr:putative Ig domain-containing protein [Pseudomonadota bacterium]MDA0965700.1 putative Ig domain-containing protein [Pseudomonadota bacterium]MDG4543024.1 putative Ig domain-containing protein [Rickettsiales bacterium]MDG4544528.1 putative Ig domain-containing protein [Rickettsiales bacterium]MDG4546650.1 putative Ig domain-containing protein [Rickettsiales bacterium]
MQQLEPIMTAGKIVQYIEDRLDINGNSNLSLDEMKDLAGRVDVSSATEGGKVSVLYSGNVDGGSAHGLANDIVNQHTDAGGYSDLGIIDKTDANILFNNDVFLDALQDAVDNHNLVNPNNPTTFENELYKTDGGMWSIASENLASKASGDILVIISPDVDANRVFAANELPKLLNNDDVNTINGLNKTELKIIYDTEGLQPALDRLTVQSSALLNTVKTGTDGFGDKYYKTDELFDHFDGIQGHELPQGVSPTGTVAGADYANWVDTAKANATDVSFKGMLVKVGLAGAILDIVFTAEDAQAAYDQNGVAGAADVIAEWVAGSLGGGILGWVTAAGVATALAPVIAGSGVAVAVGAGVAFVAGFAGGAVGDTLGRAAYDAAKELGVIPSGNDFTDKQAQKEILNNADGAKLKQELDAQGKTVGDFVKQIEQDTGESADEIINDNKEFFGEALGIPPEFNATKNNNGDVIIEGDNGLDTNIDLNTGQVHKNIPHNVNVTDVSNTNGISVGDVAGSVFVNHIMDINPNTPDIGDIGNSVIDRAINTVGASSSQTSGVDLSGAQSAVANSVASGVSAYNGSSSSELNGIALDPGQTYFLLLKDGSLQQVDHNMNKIGEPISSDEVNTETLGRVPSDEIPWSSEEKDDLELKRWDDSSLDIENSFEVASLETKNLLLPEAPSIISMVGDLVSGFAGMIGDVVGSVVSGIGSAISTVGSTISGAVTGALDFLSGLFGSDGFSVPPSGADASGGEFVAPVVIDLDNDGIELTNLNDSTVFFDVDADSYMEKTAWAGADDGLLVIDLFQDGQIVYGEEINYTLWDSTATTDMEALRNVFDTNSNNVLDLEDERFGEFRIWQDFNQNGYVDTDELQTLDAMGIDSISLDSVIPEDEYDGEYIQGNIVYDDTAVTWNNGNFGRAYDTAFEYSIGGLKFNGDSEEFSINYEDGSEVSIYQAPDSNPINIDSEINSYDVVVGSVGDDIITNNGSKDIIFDGGEGDDHLEGGAGNDWLYGGDGIDTLKGGAGNDLLFVDSDDVPANIDGGDGTDIAVITTPTSVTINISDHNIEAVFGNDGNDNFSASGTASFEMYGGAGDDELTGADGDDILNGDSGNDILNGKGGNNFLFGSLGDDTYIIEKHAGTTTEIASFDTNNSSEKIDLSDFDLTELLIITDINGTRINLGDNQYVKLTNTNVSRLDESSFIFKVGTNPQIIKHVNGSGNGEIIKGSNTDDIINVGGGSNYVVTGRGNDVVYTNPDALDVIKITYKPGATDIIYGFDKYNLTQLTYWMGQFDGDTTTGAGVITSGTTPELWEEKTVQTSFNNTTFDLTEFAHLDSRSDFIVYSIENDTVINLGNDQKIILKNYIQQNTTTDYVYGRDHVAYGGTAPAQFIIDYDILDAQVDSSNFIFSTDGNHIGSLIDDEMHGSEGMDYISGSEGDDLILGNGGTDLLTGGTGNDELYGGNNNDGISGNEGNDLIYGGTGNDALWGDQGNDKIYGEDGQDILTGGTGSDILHGGNDEDTYIFNIGDGIDTIIDEGNVNNNADIIKFEGDVSEESLILTRDEQDLIITFKNNFNDRITIKGHFTGNAIEIIRFSDNSEIFLDSIGIEINGTSGSDILYGTSRDDIINGYSGDDTIYGGEGNDTYVFNQGDGQDIIDETGAYSNMDVIRIGNSINSSEVYHEKIGNDLVINFINNPTDKITVLNHYNSDNSMIEKILFADGSELDLVNSSVNINGSIGDNIISGTSYNDIINGGEGDDVLEGGAGSDTIDGGLGDDVISYRNSSQAVNVNLSNNTASGGDAEGDTYTNIEGIEGSMFSDVLTGDAGINRIYGVDGNDNIDGQDGNDKLFGGIGADHILGGSGDDFIDGGDGSDILEGQDGNDAIFGGAGGDIILGGSGDDYLSGGTEGDIIDGGLDNDLLTTGFGDDTLTGGAGIDQFNISKSANIEDIITDYEFGIGEKIDLWAFSTIRVFEDIRFIQDGSDTVIDLENNQTLRIKNTNIGQFLADDFILRDAPEELIVNNLTDDYQLSPSISAMDNGNFVITWYSTNNMYGNNAAIKGRIFEADGTPQGDEFAIITNSGYTSGASQNVLGINGGKFVVVWDEYEVSFGHKAKGQIFNSSGQKVGSEFDFAQNSSGQEVFRYDTTVEELSNGNILIAWSGVSSDGTNGIHSQIFSSNGTPVGNEIHFVISNPSGNDPVKTYSHVDVTKMNNDRFIVTWRESYSLNDDLNTKMYNHYIQLYDNDGNQIGNNIKIIEGTDYYENGETIKVSVAKTVVVQTLSNNNFVAIWREVDQSSNSSEEKIVGQIFNSDGNEIGNEFSIAAKSWQRIDPQLTALDDGGFIVTYSALNNVFELSAGEGIYAQRFRFDGVKLGEEYHVNDSIEQQQLRPDIDQLESGDFVITWDSEAKYGHLPEKTDIYAKIYSADDVVINDKVYNHTFEFGNEISIQLPFDTFLDASGNALTYTATLANGLQLPSWLTFDPITLKFFGTPENLDIGSIGIRIIASNTTEYMTESFNINIIEPSDVYSLPVSTPEIFVNTTTVGNQDTPAITALTGGGHVIVWKNEVSDDYYKVYGQMFDAFGNKIGAEIVVSEDVNSGDLYDVTILGTSDGGFWVGWQNYDYDPSVYYNIGSYIQRYDNLGNKIGTDPIRVINDGDNAQNNISMTELTNGNISVVWDAMNFSPSGQTDMDIYNQIFDINGNAVTTPVLVNEYVTLGQYEPIVTALSNGGYVISWNGRIDSVTTTQSLAKIYDSTGVILVNEFLLSEDLSIDNRNVQLSALDNGKFAAIWVTSSEDAYDTDINGRIYDSSGLPLSEEFVVNDETFFWQQQPSVHTLDNGHFVVVWSSLYQDNHQSGVFGQVFDENGNKLGGEFLINETTFGTQNMPTITSIGGGEFVVAWISIDQDGSEGGVYSKTFTESDYQVVGSKLIIEGTDVSDKLYGSELDDTFIGRDGNDIFVIKQQSGNIDIIKDFKVDDLGYGVIYDKIDLSDFSNIRNFDDLDIIQLGAGHGNGAYLNLDLGDNQTLRLNSIDLQYKPLTEENFIFYQDINFAPQLFEGIKDKNILVGDNLEFVISDDAFFDVEGDNISYTATLADGSDLPDWLTFDPIAKTFQGAPTSFDVGNIDKIDC